MNGKSLFIMIIVMPLMLAAIGANRAAAEDEVFGIDFRPERDGYNFANNYADKFGTKEFNSTSLIHLFGEAQVCQKATLNLIDNKLVCRLNKPAEEYMHSWIDFMKGGHCHGMSVSALRTFLSTNSATVQPWSNNVSMTYGFTNVGQWQTAAKASFDLKLNAELAKYIAYYQSISSLDEEYSFRDRTSRMQTSQIVDLLTESFKNKREFYTMTIGMRGEKNKFELLHTVVPFKVTKKESGFATMISIYDPNYPNETQYLNIVNKTGLWNYSKQARQSVISPYFHCRKYLITFMPNPTDGSIINVLFVSRQSGVKTPKEAPTIPKIFLFHSLEKATF